MDTSKLSGDLQKLKKRLCKETEPRKLYKTLKKISSLPMLGEILEEIGFRQIIKLLRKHQLLVPYAKALASQWSEEFQSESQPMTELLGNCGEDLPHEWASQQKRDKDEEKPQPAKSEQAGPQKHSLSPLQRKRPSHWVPDPSFEECLNYDTSTSSALQPAMKRRLLPSKRKRKNSRDAEGQSPPAKASLAESASCQDWDGLAASFLPEVASGSQGDFQVTEPEPSSMPSDQDMPSWACRKVSKTAVYSGRPTISSGPLQQKCQPGVLAASHPWRERPCSASWDNSEPRMAEQGSRFHSHPGKPSPSQCDTQRPLQGQESNRQMGLQDLVTRLQSTQSKKPQVRQAKMIAILARPKCPQLQAASAPTGAASLEEHSFPEASAQRQQKGPPCLSLGSNPKSKTKKPAPLMAKALKAYKHRISGR